MNRGFNLLHKQICLLLLSGAWQRGVADGFNNIITPSLNFKGKVSSIVFSHIGDDLFYVILALAYDGYGWLRSCKQQISYLQNVLISLGRCHVELTQDLLRMDWKIGNITF